jgi:type I restriction enzyme S subunit
VLSVTQRGLKVRDIESNDGQLSMDYSKYQLVEPGDFVMNHMDLLTGYVDVSRTPRCDKPLTTEFSLLATRASRNSSFYICFKTDIGNGYFYAFGQGASGLGTLEDADRQL